MNSVAFSTTSAINLHFQFKKNIEVTYCSTEHQSVLLLSSPKMRAQLYLIALMAAAFTIAVPVGKLPPLLK
jgi:hypothetical protein